MPRGDGLLSVVVTPPRQGMEKVAGSGIYKRLCILHSKCVTEGLLDARESGYSSSLHTNLERPNLCSILSQRQTSMPNRNLEETMSPNTPPITVIAIDHNSTFLKEITVLILNQPDMRLLGTAVNADELVSLHRKSAPDVAVIDH
jgi:hypothetical protein